MSGTNGSLLKSILAGSNPRGQDGAQAARRALAWGRVSTDMQEERGLSLPEQLREIREYAARNGIEIVAEYQEAASAFQREDKRVEFHRMVARAKEDPSIGVILVHDMSRFSRDSVRAKTLLRELRQAGVEVISLSDPVADPETVAGVYMEAITLAKNEAYSREIAFHTRKGCRANIRTRDPETGWCYKNGGQPLWGYRTERLNKGTDKKGRPILKAIWMPDDRIVAGRPVCEWARVPRGACRPGGIARRTARPLQWGRHPRATQTALEQLHLELTPPAQRSLAVLRPRRLECPPQERKQAPAP